MKQNQTYFSIGQVAQRSQLPVKTIRYYDEIGLVKAAQVSSTGYRQYAEKEIRLLIFAKHARDFGFSIEVCRELLDLYQNPHRTSREVKEIVSDRIQEIRQKLSDIQSLLQELERLEASCAGDDRPDCPIIAHLEKD